MNRTLFSVLAIVSAMLYSCRSDDPGATTDLKDYEGTYEYWNNTRVVLTASALDTSLYAIVDEAKYPLTLVARDTFLNSSKQPVIFRRDEKGRITGVNAEGNFFKLLSDTVPKIEWYPRKEFFGQAGSYVYQPPVALGDGLITGDVRNVFSKPEELFDMVKKTISADYSDVHSILIWKDGKLVMEEYFYGYDRDKPHQLRSASKSFIGTLVGIAVDHGQIRSEEDLLIPYFGSQYEAIQNIDKRKRAITIEDFLTYRHGLDCNDEDLSTSGHESKMLASSDWVKFTLDLPMVNDPGVTSAYCTGCAQTLGRLVEVATDTPLVHYAERHLFQPMGITKYHWRFKPDTSSVTTFNQMYLRPRDMLKLALMYKDGGTWQGRVILSKEWVDKTFAPHDPEFGYLWRHKYFEVGGKRYNSYLATGNGGQKINIWPELNMITVFTGGNYNAWLYGRSTPPNEMIPEHILKAL